MLVFLTSIRHPTNSRPNTAGWYVDAGYAVNYRTQRIQRKHGLVRYCGTTLLPNAANLYQCSRMLDMHVTERSSQQDIFASFPRYFVECVLGDHKYFVAYFARNGFRMRPLPFRATAWIQETGENHTMTSGSRTGVPITTAFRKEFGIEEFGARVSPPTVVESVMCFLAHESLRLNCSVRFRSRTCTSASLHLRIF